MIEYASKNDSKGLVFLSHKFKTMLKNGLTEERAMIEIDRISNGKYKNLIEFKELVK